MDGRCGGREGGMKINRGGKEGDDEGRFVVTG